MYVCICKSRVDKRGGRVGIRRTPEIEVTVSKRG